MGEGSDIAIPAAMREKTVCRLESCAPAISRSVLGPVALAKKNRASRPMSGFFIVRRAAIDALFETKGFKLCWKILVRGRIVPPRDSVSIRVSDTLAKAKPARPSPYTIAAARKALPGPHPQPSSQ